MADGLKISQYPRVDSVTDNALLDISESNAGIYSSKAVNFKDLVTSAVTSPEISQLETDSKTVVGAINDVRADVIARTTQLDTDISKVADDLTTFQNSFDATVETIGPDDTTKLTFTKVGNVVQVYGDLTGLSSSATTVQIGRTARPSASAYSMLPCFTRNAPYAPTNNASVWVTGGGLVTLYKAASATAVYVSGTYICK